MTMSKDLCGAEKGLTKTGRLKQRLIKTGLSGANSKENAAQKAAAECNVFCETVGNGIGETGGWKRMESAARSWEWKVDGVGWSEMEWSVRARPKAECCCSTVRLTHRFPDDVGTPGPGPEPTFRSQESTSLSGVCWYLDFALISRWGG